MKKSILLTGLALITVSAHAQCYKDGYVEQGFGSPQFADAVQKWAVDKQVTRDDNFFISRIKPKARFRHAATQVRPELNLENDKKLLAWVPINDPLVNGLPDGKFDSEVFNMWSYVTHYGDWTGTVGRIPGAFADVAHKNGVGVSGVASIPFGTLGNDWSKALEAYGNLDHQTAYDFLRYYGNDGIGYNSEFTGGVGIVQKLCSLHVGLNKAAKQDGNPVFENIWYDGTNYRGGCTFDNGLGPHNQPIFGKGGEEAASLFFNYNWNSDYVINKTNSSAAAIGRSPLDIYAGMNMQGGEPTSDNWTRLKTCNLSIGLWGAHTYNMFWESRNEKGSTDNAKLRTYMLRTERYFTGGTRNPANCPMVSNSMQYNADNVNFHGMSSLMSARSSLSWDLATEPFITYFNLGNGKFFNWKGVRQNDNEWYNIGVQDYLPTWRYWFASKLLGNQATDVPAQGLDAEFTWDDAYVGGSCLRVFGSTANEYLHLFKTQYRLQAGDVITLRYKLNKGLTGLRLVLTANGAESTPIHEDQLAVIRTTDAADAYTWQVKTFTVDEALAGKDLALVALHFEGAQDMDLDLGEFSIVRGASVTPATPTIAYTQNLAYHKGGVDGKIVFNMPNDKAAGVPCYNLDVNTSMFKLYAQQEGKEPVCMGLTTSWAGLLYSCPIDFEAPSQKLRLGVAAVSLDMKKDSEIAWGEYMQPENYEYDDAIVSSKTTIKPHESFVLSYVDPEHESATWEIYDKADKKIFSAEGRSVEVKGIDKIGTYNLKVIGYEYDAKHEQRVQTTRTLNAYIVVTPESIGAHPEIYTLTANGHEADIQVEKDADVTLAYTGRQSDGALSRGLNLAEKGFGFSAVKAGLIHPANEWTCAFWVNFHALEGGTIQFFDVRDQGTNWPQNNWGAYWCSYEPATHTLQFTIRGNQNVEHTNRWIVDFTPGVWTHVAIAMNKDERGGVRERVYINGAKASCSSWSDGSSSGEGENPNNSKPNQYWNDAMILIGQGRHQCAGMDATIDDLKFYNKGMKSIEIQKIMLNNNGKEDVLFGFDNEANDKFAFDNEGAKPHVIGGLLTLEKGSGEGVGAFEFIAPQYEAGSPFIEGSKYAVVTEAQWEAPHGVITAHEGNAQAGTAHVCYKKDGVNEVTLTLKNSYGTDRKTFSAITVGAGATGIDNAEVLETEVRVENGMALVNFATAGNYVVSVYNAAGQLVATEAQHMAAGDQAQLALGQAGVYVLSVQKDGKTVAHVKLLNK